MRLKGRFTMQKSHVLPLWSSLLSTVLMWMLLMSPVTGWAQTKSGPSITSQTPAHGSTSKKAITSAGYENLPKPGRDNAFSMTVNHYGITATLQTLGSSAGSAIMEKGGNVIDAIIAANAAVGVLEPMMNGMGGDLFAIYWDNKAKKLYALNSSGWTAKGETIDALKAKGITELDMNGIYSVTVPGTVAGWQALHDRFGKLSLAEDLKPAEALAENGFPLSEGAAEAWGSARPFVDRAAFTSVYLRNGKFPKVGETFKNPMLAASLRLVGEQGRDAFYKGPIAKSILKLSQEQGGFLTAEDLADFQPEWVEPISTTYHGWTIYETPPNSQGIAALTMLNIMEHFPLRQWGHDDPRTLHTELEAKALAYADMLQYVGDPRTGKVPTMQLLSKDLANERAKLIHDRCNPVVLPSVVRDELARMGSDTTYLAAVDRDGNLVSLIQSNDGNFGGGWVPDNTGFALQNRARGMSLTPGQPNSMAGHKRPLHTIIPAFMQKDGVSIGFGIMNGWNQAQAHAQFVANIVDFDMNIQQAMDAPRFNKENTGCAVSIEPRYPLETLEDLDVRGHQVKFTSQYSGAMGRGNAVEHDDDLKVNFGASDPRADGQAVPEMPPF
jgi:gamma-glutamyltranspeptidase / glutathione hydrolase